MDSSNRFFVGRRTDGTLSIPVLGRGPLIIQPDAALNLAAWLLVMADPKAEKRIEFMRLLKEIES